MAKRLFSSSKRAESILADLRQKDINLSEYISNAVIDEKLPVFSQLRTEALYLLDYITDGAADWTGSKLMLASGTDKIQYYTIQALERGVTWLKNGHHIKDPSVLQKIISFFATDIEDDDTNEPYSEYTAFHVKQVQEKIHSTNPDISNLPNDFGHLAGIILDNWDAYWDWDISYELIIDVILCEEPIEKIDPFDAISYLQWIENQFIIEMFKDKDKR